MISCIIIASAPYGSITKFIFHNVLENLQALKVARNKAQQTARRCSNDYWLHLSDIIQQASLNDNIRNVYVGIKQTTGKLTKKIGKLTTEKGKQMERCAEHYLELYSRTA